MHNYLLILQVAQINSEFVSVQINREFSKFRVQDK